MILLSSIVVGQGDFLRKHGNFSKIGEIQVLGDIAWHGPLILAFWVRRGSIVTHYQKNCGVSKVTGAIFSDQFLKNSIF